MSIPRAKIRRVDVIKAGWECFVLHVPEGSIQPTYWVTCEAPECGYTDDWWSWDGAAHDARDHLREAHGVRTVGSLTADDLGKWIEVGGHDPLRLAYVSHCLDGLSVINDGEYCQLHIDGPSTPCRVTGERP